MKYQLCIFLAKDVDADEYNDMLQKMGPPDRIEKAEPPRDNADLGEDTTLHTYIRNTEGECWNLLNHCAMPQRSEFHIFDYPPEVEAAHLAENEEIRKANAE